MLARGCLVTPILALGELAECVWLPAVGSPGPFTATSKLGRMTDAEQGL